MSAKQKSQPREVGWRELIALPEFGINRAKAKLDTGARTSAMHALHLQPRTENGVQWVDFELPGDGMRHGPRRTAPVVDERDIKNTSGQRERRFIVETTIVLGAWRWQFELSLTNRSEMGFEIILGRTAIRRHNLLVNPGRSYLLGQPILSPADQTNNLEEGLLRTLRLDP